MEEQVALLEKSYELAAKYRNGGNNAGQAVQPEETETPAGHRGKKRMKAEAVSGVRPTTVSALPQPLTDPAFIADYGDERNYGFHTAIGTAEVPGKNTITACVQGDQTITDGQTVKLRLLELIRQEDHSRPLSDQKLAELLAEQVRHVTAERIFDAMQTVSLDTVYFLKGKETAE